MSEFFCKACGSKINGECLCIGGIGARNCVCVVCGKVVDATKEECFVFRDGTKDNVYKDHCGNCKFFLDTGLIQPYIEKGDTTQYAGVCRRRSISQPKDDDEWCGEWKPVGDK